METFDHISLTDLEAAEALRKGREAKHYELARIEYNERLKAQRKFFQPTSKDWFDLFCTQFDVDEFNKAQVIQLCHYFAGSPEFNGDLDKGLFLMGGVGVGKTSMMRFFIKNHRFSYRVDSCRDVEASFEAYGNDYLTKVSYNLPIAVNSDPFGNREIGYCFDDLGTESNGKYFGKEKNVMAEVLLNRYDNGLPYNSTHLTTNLSADAIKTQYGTRVTDRFNQMFNLIKFPKEAISRRK